MLHRAIATLRDTLRPPPGLSKDRVETLSLIVVAMVSARTVNLSHLAAERPGPALVAPTCRRLQRFFRHVRLGPDWSAPIAARLAGLQGPWYLALETLWFNTGTLGNIEGRNGYILSSPSNDALAIAWAAQAARDLLATRWPRRKSHGYLAKSRFRTGFDRIRNLLRSNPLQTIDPWRRINENPCTKGRHA